MPQRDRALVVFSGGQDSTTCLYWALQRYKKVSTLTFDYGQRHRLEIRAAKKIAALAKVPWRLLKLDSFKALTQNALTGKSPVQSGSGRGGLPNTFVPGRNLIFLSTAAAVAYQEKILDLVTGVCETDYSGYPDCRAATIRALEKSLRLGMEYPISIKTPLMKKTKAQTVRLSKRVGALEALKHSRTCYNGKHPPCGKCPACKIRARGFQEAGIVDPALGLKKS